MSENSEQKPINSGLNGQEKTHRSPLVVLLGVLVSIEALLVTTGAVYFLSRIFLETPENLSGAIVIFAITLIIAIGLVVVGISIFRELTWTRGAIVTWQILQFAVATSFVQGFSLWQYLGWTLIFLSVAGFVLVLSEKINTK